MPAIALSLVLLSALIHAGWNYLCKRDIPSVAFFIIAKVAVVLVMLPCLLYFAPRLTSITPPLWGLFVMTSFFNALYFGGLAHAYRLHDISVVYPMARAIPVLLVPFFCAVIGYGQPLSALAIIGIIAIATGCLILPMQSLKFSLQHYLHRSLIFVGITALSTAGYTITDSIILQKLTTTPMGFSSMEAAFLLSTFQSLLTLPFFALYILCVREERHHLKTLMGLSKRFAILAGLISTLGYGLILVAMQYTANVSYIVALRQTSILFGFLIGVYFLKEQTPIYKLAGVTLIFIGLIATAIG